MAANYIDIGMVYYEFKTYGVAFECWGGYPTANPGDYVIFKVNGTGMEGDKSYLLYNNYLQQFRLVYDEADPKDIDYTMWRTSVTYLGKVLDAKTMLILSM